jgi:hypothetical protein
VPLALVFAFSAFRVGFFHERTFSRGRNSKALESANLLDEDTLTA